MQAVEPLGGGLVGGGVVGGGVVGGGVVGGGVVGGGVVGGGVVGGGVELPLMLTEKELVSRPAPPCHSSNPASTSIRYQLLLV